MMVIIKLQFNLFLEMSVNLGLIQMALCFLKELSAFNRGDKIFNAKLILLLEN